jgi:hypothetical protein
LVLSEQKTHEIPAENILSKNPLTFLSNKLVDFYTLTFKIDATKGGKDAEKLIKQQKKYIIEIAMKNTPMLKEIWGALSENIEYADDFLGSMRAPSSDPYFYYLTNLKNFYIQYKPNGNILLTPIDKKIKPQFETEIEPIKLVHKIMMDDKKTSIYFTFDLKKPIVKPK